MLSRRREWPLLENDREDRAGERVIAALKSLAYDLEDSGVNVTMLNLDDRLVFANVREDDRDRVERTGRILADRHRLELGITEERGSHGLDMTVWFEPKGQ